MRQIPSADHLAAEVEGTIADVDGILKITRIHLRYRVEIPFGSRQIVQRVLTAYADKCPAYQSVRQCIECSWEAVLVEYEP